MEKNQKLIQMFSIYIIYFLYSYFGSSMLQGFFPWSSALLKFFLDCLFLLGIVFVYRKNLKEDLEQIRKNWPVKKVIKILVLGVVCLFALNIVMGILSDFIFPNITIDENTLAIKALADDSLFYAIFKTMIFGVIAEELLFRETLNECIENNSLYILFSAAIYTLMNLIFSSNHSNMLLSAAIYFIPALVFSFIYIKTNRNIILLMDIKFCYNLIPLMILLFGKI